MLSPTGLPFLPKGDLISFSEPSFPYHFMKESLFFSMTIEHISVTLLQNDHVSSLQGFSTVLISFSSNQLQVVKSH
jgi:hypothetical protein